MMVVAEYANVRFLYFPVFQMFGEIQILYGMARLLKLPPIGKKSINMIFDRMNMIMSFLMIYPLIIH